jgi:hypothetical protein
MVKKVYNKFGFHVVWMVAIKNGWIKANEASSKNVAMVCVEKSSRPEKPWAQFFGESGS